MTQGRSIEHAKKKEAFQGYRRPLKTEILLLSSVHCWSMVSDVPLTGDNGTTGLKGRFGCFEMHPV